MAPGEGNSFGTRLAKAFRPKASSKLQKRPKPGPSTGAPAEASDSPQYEIRSPSPTYRKEAVIDSQLGERQDNTALLHSLVYDDEVYDEQQLARATNPACHPRYHALSRIPLPIWDEILRYLTPFEAASLAFTTKGLLWRLGFQPWQALNHPENHQYKIQFLLTMDGHLPNHLLCFLCASYHYRTHPGNETLKPATAHNPLYKCPKAFDLPFPRTRITPRRNLPFSFLQLVMRAKRYGPAYGIPVESLVRRWKEDHWSHQSQVAVINGHLYMRVSSSCFAESGLTESEVRLLLFSRDDYSPYFSICAHWRDGMLMELCKCALSHIRRPPDSVEQKIKDRLHHRLYDPHAIVTLCESCRPMRRCPDCPSEYLIEMKNQEDRLTNSFKRAIIVTRWCDLGDGLTPSSPEWAACNGELKQYDSFGAIGRRAISGMFEAHFTSEHIPGQRILNLNPRAERHSHDDPNWY
ncbi:hypothetical protein V490_08054 [Pseudogymnoascus sp. VKM F-3557]|nr:hypothetical protein V490_08054 [Pseudogymnoascus sp. VKM F-3557]